MGFLNEKMVKESIRAVGNAIGISYDFEDPYANMGYFPKKIRKII